MSEQTLLEQFLEPYWEQFDFYGSEQLYFESLAALPYPADILLLCTVTVNEVENGGFAQYFFNATGIVAPEAVDAFNKVGLPEVASIVTEAMSVLATDYPRDRLARLELLPDFPKQPAFDALNKKFYRTVGSDFGPNPNGWHAKAGSFLTAHGLN